MKLGEIKKLYQNELEALYPLEEIKTFFNWLCEAYLQLKPFQIQQDLDLVIEANSLLKFQSALNALKVEKPIQYILGSAHFYGMEFMVNEHTLIPRPETEELVSWILKDVSKSDNLNILDIGTGTGCIPIAIAKNLPNARVYALDVSVEALKIAKRNAESNNVKVTFSEVDILKCSDLSIIFPEVSRFDVIVSNPPYVRNLEKKEMNTNVLAYEPETALFVADDNALLFYEIIAVLASSNLKEGGKLYFEINQYLGKEMLELMEKYKFSNNQLKKDLFGNNRMMKGEK
ncbi:protein-(glutamine-N5) methyltransferase, release factor-specific [Galbibacter orientalis DSM 19592]|uniref:Protein-(Glutamine-N5) methyltransferase, release factor-specific n=1 Tax=Galbibacter orientalis DSM 19592 TaxID=926559 RepID=I3C937_9FLAO|nr:peptide chain release factor N(5)-glutamine methyltransferase [Galbibacter orientalis]EIJ40130.1 protein-(glutamine-N5) methyltransferase, release factor-specific [Galbibacter orientalis DSM 19592]